MQIFDSDEMPPPMPFNCRPLGSGLPMAARKIGSHWPRSGRSRWWNMTARLVPPRMKTAGRARSGMWESSWNGLTPVYHAAARSTNPPDSGRRMGTRSALAFTHIV